MTQAIVAWREHHEWQSQTRTIWMDGRPHPPEWAPHTWQGFSTGEWIGDTLKVTTTHLKMAFIDRNVSTARQTRDTSSGTGCAA